jgi:serine protease Do
MRKDDSIMKHEVVSTLRRLTLVTTTVAGLGAAMFVAGSMHPGANLLFTPALAKSLSDEAKSTARGWLGVHIQSITAELAESMGLKAAEGALIAEPHPNSPATRAGLKAGDVITGIDGTPVKDASELARKIAAMHPGTTINLGIVRDGAEQTMTVALADMRQHAQGASADREARTNDEPRIGLVVAAAESAGAGDQGVVVTAIDPKGIAAGHGFLVGDIILEVAGRAVKTPEDVRKAIADARSGQRKNLLVRVKSGDIMKYMAVPLARA